MAMALIKSPPSRIARLDHMTVRRGSTASWKADKVIERGLVGMVVHCGCVVVNEESQFWR